ncbi:MAG: hypothetical protein IT349_21720, partial [Candidatus Eisenbacteria bacterium]|nr:hypothetical protein [Candidatus Eisenbacteria bacterium]
EIPCASDVADGSGDARLALFRPRPNPSATTTEFSFSLPASSGAGARTQLDLYGADGRQIRRLLDRDLSPGVHQVVWDGRDDAGRRLPSGTYFCRLTVEGKALKRQVQLIR